MNKALNVLVCSVMVFLVLVTTIGAETKPNLPPIKRYPEYLEIAKKYQGLYTENNRDHKVYYLDEYSPIGDYFNFSIRSYGNNHVIQVDENEIPKVKYGTEYHYNPVTVMHYALHLHSRYMKGVEKERERFLRVADFLMTLADDEGAYRYDFPYNYYLAEERFEPGWVSGMAQGQALSVYARAYHLTADKKYLDAGNKALHFLIKPVEEGGTLSTLKYLDPSLEDYIYFEEYVVYPHSYTLNGHLFAMVGVYDWAAVTGNTNARKYWRESLESLKLILPYYDIGGMSAYDLAHMTYDRDPHALDAYHMVHLYLLDGIYSITKDVYFDYIRAIWESYVSE